MKTEREAKHTHTLPSHAVVFTRLRDWECYKQYEHIVTLNSDLQESVQSSRSNVYGPLPVWVSVVLKVGGPLLNVYLHPCVHLYTYWVICVQGSTNYLPYYIFLNNHICHSKINI